MKKGKNIQDIEKLAYLYLKKSLKEKNIVDKDHQNTPIRRKRNELMRDILIFLALGGVITAAFLFPNLPSGLYPFLKKISKKFNTTPKNFIYSIEKLKKRKLIRITKKGEEHFITINDEGKKYILKYSLSLLKLPKYKEWDGYWRIVIFDIPNKKEIFRKLFSKWLKNLGLYRLQKSVYVYPFDIKKEIDFLSAVLGVYENIIYIKAKVIEGEEFLKYKFHLNKIKPHE
ncbi:MAG: CRISPR-associated endonuclease Cas2 [Candidatus Aenigmatarchaeota archaeon]